MLKEHQYSPTEIFVKEKIKEINIFNPDVEKLIKKTALAINQPDHILITGETGTGKDLLAKEVIQSRLFHKNPELKMVNINCAQIAGDKVFAVSELFGHTANAFTGAGDEEKKGILITADIIILQEIQELGTDIQAQLLNFIEYGEYRLLGSSESQMLLGENRFRKKIIFTTNLDIEDPVVRHDKDKGFRDDLYYRIVKGIKIRMPSIREMYGIYPEILSHTVEKVLKYPLDEMPINLMGYLESLWGGLPGNFRQLEEIIKEELWEAVGHPEKFKYDKRSLKEEGWPRLEFTSLFKGTEDQIKRWGEQHLASYRSISKLKEINKNHKIGKWTWNDVGSLPPSKLSPNHRLLNQLDRYQEKLSEMTKEEWTEYIFTIPPSCQIAHIIPSQKDAKQRFLYEYYFNQFIPGETKKNLLIGWDCHPMHFRSIGNILRNI